MWYLVAYLLGILTVPAICLAIIRIGLYVDDRQGSIMGGSLVDLGATSAWGRSRDKDHE